MSEGGSATDIGKYRRIFIVRHGQSAANAGGRTVETATTPITDIGIRQAQCVADLVSERPALIAISRYQRTGQTAEPLLRRYIGVPMEQWPIEEFTHLDTTACAGTTYAERKGLRDSYWKRCDPFWVDGPGCECFADFIGRVRGLEHRLDELGRDETVVVFSHGFVMRALLWLQQHTADQINGAEMADFYNFQRSISVPNCAVLRGSPNESGCLQLSPNASVAHIPVDLRTG
jgi:broad specificity phosphatase PhoE